MKAKDFRTGDVLGVRLAGVTYDEAVALIEEMVATNQMAAVSFCNTHLVAEAARDPAGYGKVLQGFDLNVPDGMPLVWALNAQGMGLKDRVYGPYLMRRFFEPGGARAGLRHFFFGGTPEVQEKLQANLRAKGGSAVYVGAISPIFRETFSEEENAEYARAINAAHPDCIWVALGGVRQERWIAENKHRLPRGVFLAVGDAFALLAGEGSFAPAWMQRAGLTWLYRLIRDPRRLMGRYLRYNGLFIYMLMQSFLRGRGKNSQ